MVLSKPTEITNTGLHTLSNGDAAGTPHAPAYVVVIPPGDWNLIQVSARVLFLQPGAHLTLEHGSGGLPLVSHLYGLSISNGAVLNDVDNALQENLTFIAPGGTLEMQPTAGNTSAGLPDKFSVLTNGGSLKLDTPVYYTQNIELPGSHVSKSGNLLQMPSI